LDVALQLPVITTNWSGPVAFVNEHVAYPLAITGVDVIKDDPSDPSFVQAFVGQAWATPSIPHLVQLLQRVYRHPAEAAAKGRAAREHIQRHFTPAVVARAVALEVQRLQGVVRQRQQQQQAAAGGSRQGGLFGKIAKLGLKGGRPVS
jgi:hypothetical protein